MFISPIQLISCDKVVLENILEGDSHIAALLKINVIENWTEFGSPIFQFALGKIIKNPDSVKWWTYLPIHMESNTLIGSCGFKGPPNDAGEVEIGYEVANVFRNKGYATQISNQLIDIAFKENKVKSIIAHTLAEPNASVRVLQKCKFEFVEQINDPEDGLIWKWQLMRK